MPQYLSLRTFNLVARRLKRVTKSRSSFLLCLLAFLSLSVLWFRLSDHIDHLKSSLTSTTPGSIPIKEELAGLRSTYHQTSEAPLPPLQKQKAQPKPLSKPNDVAPKHAMAKMLDSEKVEQTFHLEAGHPIPQLIKNAEERMRRMEDKQSATLEEAVDEYRRRYGISPPPNFDKWYAFAKARDVVLVDEFDDIHKTLIPFWALKPSVIRARAKEALGGNNNLLGLMIRDQLVVNAMGGKPWFSTAIKGMLSSFIDWLPDMDLCFNIHDEPRVVLPHDDLQKLVNTAQSKYLPAAGRVSSPRNSWSSRPEDLGNGVRIAHTMLTRFNIFAHQAVWTHSKMSCHIDSPARDLEDGPKIDHSASYSITDLGLIYNHTAFANICESPSFSENYGFFTGPNAMNVAHDLFPIFSQSKISSYADILYPSPWYWANKVAYEAEHDKPWTEKMDDVYWRGSTTGGYSRSGGWRNHHRQRVVQKMNSKDKGLIYEDSTNPTKPPLEFHDVVAGAKVDASSLNSTDSRMAIQDPVDGSKADYDKNSNLTKDSTGSNTQSPLDSSHKPGGSKSRVEKRLVADGATSSELTPESSATDGTSPFTPALPQDLQLISTPRSLYSPLMNISFSHIGQCDPGDCEAQKAFFHIAPVALPSEAFAHKLLLDMDGNAFSGRFYAFLRSNSLVLKMNIFLEWHQEWLMPWLHYIPLSLKGEDWLEVVRWFGWEEAGQEDAERLADVKRRWAQRVLRNEDLEVWFFRLLLEYGRIVDDDREIIGYSP